MVLCGISTSMGYNGQAEFRWLMLVHANGVEVGAVIKCNDEHKHEKPPYVSLSASF